jgi:hypothetical protein
MIAALAVVNRLVWPVLGVLFVCVVVWAAAAGPQRSKGGAE